MGGPLAGIRVLDFTRFQQGPYATVMLADLGAEIWKVESREGGDGGRAMMVRDDGFCPYFEAHDRGKLSITLDVRTEAGREIVLRLAEQVDVVVENFRPGVMDRLGIGYAALKERNDDLIMVSCSAFGPSGPLAKRPGYDVIGQAMSGVMTLNQRGAEAEPLTLPGGFADQIGGMQACIATLAAIVARERQGRGQQVDVSLLGSQIALQSFYLTGYLHDGKQPREPRRRMPTFTFYEASDHRWLVIGVTDTKNWTALCRELEIDELIDDERYSTPNARLRNHEALEAILEERFAGRDRDDWLRRLTEADIPNAPVNDYAAITGEAQAWENGYFEEVEHPKYGAIKVAGVPWQFSETGAAVSGVAPELGADTESILGKAGLTADEIAALRSAEVI